MDVRARPLTSTFVALAPRAVNRGARAPSGLGAAEPAIDNGRPADRSIGPVVWTPVIKAEPVDDYDWIAAGSGAARRKEGRHDHKTRGTYR